jgi:hypothetical protein
MKKTISYTINYYNEKGEWDDCDSDYPAEGAAVAHAGGKVNPNGHAVVQQVTTVDCVKLSRSKKIIVTKIK